MRERQKLKEQEFAFSDTTIETLLFKSPDGTSLRITRNCDPDNGWGPDSELFSWKTFSKYGSYVEKDLVLNFWKEGVSIASLINGIQSTIHVDIDGTIRSLSYGMDTHYDRTQDGRFALTKDEVIEGIYQHKPSFIFQEEIPHLNVLGVNPEQQKQLLERGLDIAATRLAIRQLFESKNPALPTTALVYK